MSSSFLHLVNIYFKHDNLVDIFHHLRNLLSIFGYVNKFSSLDQNLIIELEKLK